MEHLLSLGLNPPDYVEFEKGETKEMIENFTIKV